MFDATSHFANATFISETAKLKKHFFLSTLVFTYSNASNSHILQHQRPTFVVCGAHTIKLIVTWQSNW